jgi:hypothetical protein
VEKPQRQKRREEPFEDVDDHDGQSVFQALDAEDVRGPRALTAEPADVAPVRRMDEEIARGDRSQQIRGDREEDPHVNSNPAIALYSAPWGLRTLSKRVSLRAVISPNKAPRYFSSSRRASRTPD